MQNPRKVAFKALMKMESDEGYSNIVIDSALSSSDMERRDKGLCSAIFYGVLERKITLDGIISKYSKTPLKKLSLGVKTALRMGLYQLLFMDKIPESAAVDQSSDLSKIRRTQGFPALSTACCEMRQETAKRLFIATETIMISRHLNIRYRRKFICVSKRLTEEKLPIYISAAALKDLR